MTAKILLRNRKKEIVAYARVNEDDYDNVMKYKWSRVFTINEKTGRVKSYATGGKTREKILLHHFILGKPPKKMVVDHIDGDGLNNRRDNLRFATYSQNNQNIDRQKSNTYIGVQCKNEKWHASSSGVHLGCYDLEEQAAEAYDTYCYVKYGVHAKTNGLIKYEDVLQFSEQDLIITKPERNLPTNICIRKNGKFYAMKVYNNKRYQSSYFIDINDAITALITINKQIEAVKKYELDAHNNQEIQRNVEGQAIIPIRGEQGAIDYAIVDDENWYDITLYRWGLNKGYAVGYINTALQNKPMSHYIMGFDDNDILIDHINNEKLDNRMSNLRKADFGLNNHNRQKPKNATSKYNGVSWSITNQKWHSKCNENNKTNFIGYFDNEIEAAIEYNNAVTKIYGNDARLNALDDDVLQKYREKYGENRQCKTIQASKYRGVTLDGKNWRVNIQKDFEIKYIGRFEDEIEAALAYNTAAQDLHGGKRYTQQYRRKNARKIL